MTCFSFASDIAHAQGTISWEEREAEAEWRTRKEGERSEEGGRQEGGREGGREGGGKGRLVLGCPGFQGRGGRGAAGYGCQDRRLLGNRYFWGPRRADMWLGGDALTSRQKPAVGCGAARRSREALASTATPSPRVGPLPCAQLSVVTVGASATEILDVLWI